MRSYLDSSGSNVHLEDEESDDESPQPHSQTTHLRAGLDKSSPFAQRTARDWPLVSKALKFHMDELAAAHISHLNVEKHIFSFGSLSLFYSFIDTSHRSRVMEAISQLLRKYLKYL